MYTDRQNEFEMIYSCSCRMGFIFGTQTPEPNDEIFFFEKNNININNNNNCVATEYRIHIIYVNDYEIA